MNILLFLGGLGALIIGAELMVRGASRLAAVAGISPLVIGLTVVAFGTSSPELAVGVQSAFSGQAALAVGNVIGSNVFNVLFILGLSALITPLVVSVQLIRLDVPILIGLSAGVWLLALDGRFVWWEGLLLVMGLLVYTTFLIVSSRRATAVQIDASALPGIDQSSPAENRPGRDVVFVLVGLGLLVLGSQWLVDSAVAIAQRWGLSELIIGLTIVSAGTSMPEVVTSIVAGLRGERDIAVGNVVGSNLFNLMGVLGVLILAAPGGIELSTAVVGFDLPVMTAVAVAALPIFFTGGQISRWEGGFLLAYYAAYTTYLILAATQHAALPLFSATLLYFVLPITAVTLAVVVLQARRGS